VQDFRELLTELRGEAPPHSAHARIAAASQAAVESLRRRREEAQGLQREMRRRVHASKEKLREAAQERDEQRMQHRQKLHEALATLVHGAMRALDGRALFGADLSSKAESAVEALREQQDCAVARGKEVVEEMLRTATEAVGRVNGARNMAGACVARYVAAHEDGRRMGTWDEGQAEIGGGDDADAAASLCASAVKAYERWEGTVGIGVAERETDEALEALKAAMSESCAGLFDVREEGGGSVSGQSRHVGAVRSAAVRCGRALAAEEEARHRDFLAEMPCGVLFRAGRALAGARDKVHISFVQLSTAVAEVCEELEWLKRVCEGGEQWNRKEEHVKNLKVAMKAVKRVRGELMVLKGKEMAIAADSDSDDTGGEIDEQRAAQEIRLREALAAMRDALDAITQIESDFPEMMAHLGMVIPRGLRGVWGGESTLEEMFERRERIPGHGRHTVWRCSDGKGGEEFAVKVFAASESTTCLREAALLVRMHHPQIVRVVSVLRDPGTGFLMIQMPLYKYGSVQAWIHDTVPLWKAVRVVFHDIAGALAHLHKNEVVHADVKPDNILVGPNERGVLADFDCSVDSNTRTTQLYLAAPPGVVAESPGFGAPELRHPGALNTKKADVFALGRSVKVLREKCADAESAESLQETDDFVDALTAAAPGDRPSADEATRHDFFRPVLEHRAEQASECVGGCFERKRHTDGVVCAEGHLMCRGCLEQWVQCCVNDDQGVQEKRGGHVPCPHMTPGRHGKTSACGAPKYSDEELAGAVPAKVFEAYVQAQVKLKEKDMQAEADREVKKRVKEEIERLKNLSEEQRAVLAARKDIDEVLMSRCPAARCRAPWSDFTGCCALTCGSCNCRFCAWCDKVCPDSGACHDHAGSCSAKPPGVNGLFPGDQQIVDRVRVERRANDLRACLQDLPDTTRAPLLRELRGEHDPLGRTLRERYAAVLAEFQEE